MAEVRRSNHKQKCPVCQKDRASDVIKVSFWIIKKEMIENKWW